MPNPCHALTAAVPRSIHRRRALLHPCSRPALPRNSRPTQPYMITILAGKRSMRNAAAGGLSASRSEFREDGLVISARGAAAERFNGYPNQLLDVCLAL